MIRIYILTSLFVFLNVSVFGRSVKMLTLDSRGEKQDYQMQFLRLHKGDGVDRLSGGNDRVQHLYLGNDIDDDFFGVRFYEADRTTPIVHRRMICVTGQYADFILKLDLPPAGQSKQVVLDYASTGRTTESSDATLLNIHFYGWVRQGVKRNGWLYDQWGVEPTTVIKDGKIQMWVRGSEKGGRGRYGLEGLLRYAESSDGLTWTDLGQATGIGAHEGQPFVYRDEEGLYHMVYNDHRNVDGVHDYRYLTSPSGKNGTWTIKAESVLKTDSWPGNIGFWRENNTWHFLYEYMAKSGVWVTSYASGPSLEKLVKYNEGAPVMSGAGMVGGPEVHKVGSTYYMFGHAGENAGNLPTSAICYKSTNLTEWTRVGWLVKRYYHPVRVAQVADPSIKEFMGKTFVWYESQPDQDESNVPWLSAAVWDQPLERLMDPTITTAVFDDLEAEGWTFEKGFGEHDTDKLGTVFRKLSDCPSPLSENCVVLKTQQGRKLKVKKAIGTLATENVFEFYARTEQVNKKFEAFRIDKDNAAGILAGVWFDADGTIKYYSGKAVAVAQTYTPSTYYRFQIFQKKGGYDLKINSVTVATNIPYYSAYAQPAYFCIGQDEDARGYISALYTRQYSDPSTEPIWSGSTGP